MYIILQVLMLNNLIGIKDVNKYIPFKNKIKILMLYVLKIYCQDHFIISMDSAPSAINKYIYTYIHIISFYYFKLIKLVNMIFLSN